MNGTIGRGRRRWRMVDGTITLAGANARHTISIDARPDPIVLDVDRTALVVVDMQNDFCHPDGWLASIGVDVEPATAPIRPLVDSIPVLRSADIPIVWLDWGARPDRMNLPPNVIHVYDSDGSGVGIGSAAATGFPVLEAGSWGAALVDELGHVAAENDIRIDKHRMSGFWDTELDSTLRNLDVTTVLFAGVNADQCVLATLIDAACAGYDVVMLEDACATTSPAYCWDATVYNVRQCFGFTARLADVADACSGAWREVAT